MLKNENSDCTGFVGDATLVAPVPLDVDAVAVVVALVADVVVVVAVAVVVVVVVVVDDDDDDDARCGGVTLLDDGAAVDDVADVTLVVVVAPTLGMLASDAISADSVMAPPPPVAPLRADDVDVGSDIVVDGADVVVAVVDDDAELVAKQKCRPHSITHSTNDAAIDSQIKPANAFISALDSCDSIDVVVELDVALLVEVVVVVVGVD
jgi:hypothetical protein